MGYRLIARAVIDLDPYIETAAAIAKSNIVPSDPPVVVQVVIRERGCIEVACETLEDATQYIVLAMRQARERPPAEDRDGGSEDRS